VSAWGARFESEKTPTRLKQSDSAFGFGDRETPLERYSRSCDSLRLAEQLRAATLNIAETVANEGSSATFLTAGPLDADSFIILFRDEYLAAAANLPPRHELEDKSRIRLGFTCNLKRSFSRRRPAFSPEP
jgi:hypothetical protein